MVYPKLKTRPRSTHTVTQFGGLLHNEEAPLGQWYDERNLSAAEAPAFSLDTGWKNQQTIDGNTITRPILGVCGGEHLVILDDEEVLHCNGHSIALPIYQSYAVESTEASIGAGVVEISVDEDGQDTAALLTAAFGDVQSVVFTWRGTVYEANGNSYAREDLDREFGIFVQITSGALTVGDTITINLRPDYPYADWDYDDPRSILRMGAWAVIYPECVAVNVVKLAEGTATLDDVVGLRSYWETPADASPIEVGLTPCRADGKTIFDGGCTVGATEPTEQSGIWVDTSGDKTVWREWSTSMSMWVAITEPYVRIVATLDHPYQADVSREDALSQWDGVVFATDDDLMDYRYIHSKVRAEDAELDARLLEEVKSILNSSHLLYDVTYDAERGMMTMLVPGVITADHTVGPLTRGRGAFTVQRRTPKMDFVVEEGNRLWGCRYGQDEDGNVLNEIYASALGDYRNWSQYRGISTDSWTASRGTAAPFTGAAVLHGSPLFFRENSVEKVYPSATGAHQVQTFDLDGVADGAWRSLVVIDERLYYKSKEGVCVYTGTLPQRISDEFGNLRYDGGTAGRDDKHYMISMENRATGETIVGDYDTELGVWHLLGGGWNGAAATWSNRIYVVRDGRLFGRGTPETGMVSWYAESGIIGYALPEHRFISCVRIRYTMAAPSQARVYIRYEDDDQWQLKATLRATSTQEARRFRTQEANIFPKRCDHFRLRIEGYGRQVGFKILSISYRMERSEGGH